MQRGFTVTQATFVLWMLINPIPDEQSNASYCEVSGCSVVIVAKNESELWQSHFSDIVLVI